MRKCDFSRTTATLHEIKKIVRIKWCDPYEFYPTRKRVLQHTLLCLFLCFIDKSLIMMWHQLKTDFSNEREDTISNGVAHQKHNKIEGKGKNMKGKSEERRRRIKYLILDINVWLDNWFSYMDDPNHMRENKMARINFTLELTEFLKSRFRCGYGLWTRHIVGLWTNLIMYLTL